MTVSVSNTNLNDSFNSWRLNTNFAATVLSNNVVTVARAGSANRGGVAKGNGHVAGTFTANQLRTVSLKSGNTSSTGNFIVIGSNTNINATSFSVTANSTFQGNVNFAISGTDRIILGDISRIRVTGGSRGQFVRISGSTDTPTFKSLTLRDITDLSTNSAPIILSGSNTTFSDNNDSPALILTNGTDRAFLYMASDVTIGDSDVFLKLVDADGDSRFAITDSANVVVGFVTSDGEAVFTANVTSAGLTTTANILPQSDDAVDLGAPNREFRNAYIDGIAYIDELSMATGAGQGVATSLIPKTDAAGNLGSTTRKWGTVWADTTNGGAGVFNTMGISGTLNANGAVTLGSTLGVTGVATLSSDASVSGQLNVGENVIVTGNTEVGNILTVTGATTLSSTLAVTSTASFNGAVNLGDASTDVITVKGNFANQSTTGLAQFNGSVDLGNSTSDTLTITAQIDSDFDPQTGSQRDMGATNNRWHNIYANNVIANNITTDNNMTVLGDLTVSGSTTIASGQILSVDDGVFQTLGVIGTLTANGDVDLGNATTDSITVTGQFDSALIPITDDTYDLGSATKQWQDIWIDGTASIDTLDVDENADISGKLSNDGTTVIGSNGKLHANNTITNETITNAMLTNDHYTIATNGTGADFDIQLNDTLNFNEGEGIDITIGSDTITIASEDASTTNKGVASFNTNDFTVSSGAVSIKSGGVSTAQLANTMNISTFQTHGSASQIPVISVNGKGQVIGISNTTVAGVTGLAYTQSNNNIRITTATGATFDDVIDSATANTDGSNGGLTNRGVASFNSEDFSVSSGLVSLKNATTGAVLAISGTSNEVNVSRSNGTVTVGLPDDVTVTGQLSVGENIVISGNLIVNGTTTTINSTTVRVEDNIIVLNEGVTGTPSLNSGITVERGTSNNVSFLYDESLDRWTFTNKGGSFHNIPVPSEYDNYSSWTISDHDGTTYTITSGDTLQIAEGDGIDSNFTGDDVLTITNTKPFDYFVVEDGDGTEVQISNLQEWKFVEGGGVDINWTDTSSGSDADPYDLTFTINTGITAGYGISGGGILNATRTIAFDSLELTEVTSFDSSGGSITTEDSFLIHDITDNTAKRILAQNIPLSAFNDDLAVGSVTSIGITPGAGIDVSGSPVTSSGNITVSVESDLRGDVSQIGLDTNDYYKIQATQHNWFLDGAEDMRLTNTGNLDVEGSITAFSATVSDIRLKENIERVTGAVEKVQQLNGYTFSYKKDGKKSAGVIAQEVADVLPSAVRNHDILNGDGKYLVVEYDQLTALLIESIKELKAEIDELKNNK